MAIIENIGKPETGVSLFTHYLNHPELPKVIWVKLAPNCKETAIVHSGRSKYARKNPFIFNKFDWREVKAPKDVAFFLMSVDQTESNTKRQNDNFLAVDKEPQTLIALRNTPDGQKTKFPVKAILPEAARPKDKMTPEAEAEAKTKAEADAKIIAEAEAKTKADAKAKEKQEAEAAAKQKAEERALLKAELEAEIKAEAEAAAKQKAKADAKAEAKAKLKET